MTDKEIILECPHCNGVIIVLEKQLNCKIFRHGIFKKNGNQIDPHLKKDECEMLMRDKKILSHLLKISDILIFSLKCINFVHI